MTNEYNEEVIDSTTDDTVEETASETTEVENTEGETEETTKSEEVKAEPKKRTPQEELKYFEGRAKRLRKELGMDKPEAKKETTTETKSDLDYGEKAYLRSFDIKGSDEISLVKNWMKRTGDSLDAIVEDEIFQAKLNNLREAKRTADAIPKGGKRGSTVSQDESYWLSKIESGQARLSDIQDEKMKRSVLNKRVENERAGNRFSSTPIVMG